MVLLTRCWSNVVRPPFKGVGFFWGTRVSYSVSKELEFRGHLFIPGVSGHLAGREVHE
jgi:hypothetical protein